MFSVEVVVSELEELEENVWVFDTMPSCTIIQIQNQAEILFHYKRAYRGLFALIMVSYNQTIIPL